jgi:BirA family biotin operon repressor/biotin-[acetyl-CoA-carboxylase] ligase
MSVVLRPDMGEWPRGGSRTASTPSLLTLAGGVAVAEALRHATGLPIELKWPNDVMIGVPRRKLAGLLAEASGTGPAIHHVVLGIGVNLRPAAYPPELRDRATSLETELGRPIEPGLVLTEILVSLAAIRRTSAAEVLARWRALAPSSSGATIEWASDQGQRRATTAGIDDDGALLARTGAGVERIIAGEVRWIEG